MICVVELTTTKEVVIAEPSDSSDMLEVTPA
jgi:hypothetical protein